MIICDIVSSDGGDNRNILTPVDIYFLEKWNEFSNETIEEQRIRLCRDYIAMGRDARHLYYLKAFAYDFERDERTTVSKPTAAQISNILNRIRPSTARLTAYDLGRRAGMVWLRTFYDRESQAFPGLADAASIITQGEELLLDDADKYNYGDQWQKIFDVFPEIVDCTEPGYPDPDERRRRIDELTSGPYPDEAMAEFITVTGSIFVQDEEAERTGKARLVWIGEYGGTIKESRLDIDDCETYGNYMIAAPPELKVDLFYSGLSSPNADGEN